MRYMKLCLKRLNRLLHNLQLHKHLGHLYVGSHQPNTRHWRRHLSDLFLIHYLDGSQLRSLPCLLRKCLCLKQFHLRDHFRHLNILVLIHQSAVLSHFLLSFHPLTLKTLGHNTMIGMLVLHQIIKLLFHVVVTLLQFQHQYSPHRWHQHVSHLMVS